MRMRRMLSILSLGVVLPLAACTVDPLSIGPAPDAPSNLRYELIPSGDPNAPNGVILTWVAPANGQAVTYDVYGRSSTSADWGRRATTTSVSFHDAGVPELQYYVLARDEQGNALGQTEAITIDERNRLPAPIGLASISLNRAIQLQWSSNALNANPTIFSYYRVYSASYDASRNQCGSDYGLEGTTVTDAFFAGDLTNGVSRCYWVSAVSTDGHESSWSIPRQDTPRYDARNILVYSSDVRPDSSGFLFYDSGAQRYGVVTSSTRGDLDFVIRRHSDGSLWFDPARSDVQMALYSTSPVTDLTSIDRAAISSLGNVTVEAVPGYAYVFATRKADGVHYAGLRVAFVGQEYVVFDWSYQSAVGNPELDRMTPLARLGD